MNHTNCDDPIHVGRMYFRYYFYIQHIDITHTLRFAVEQFVRVWQSV